jgi:hypothetical protein
MYEVLLLGELVWNYGGVLGLSSMLCEIYYDFVKWVFWHGKSIIE